MTVPSQSHPSRSQIVPNVDKTTSVSSSAALQSSDRIVAGAGGIGGGSVFLLIADQFPQGGFPNQLLKYIAPWATALVTGGWLYLQGEFILKWRFVKSVTASRKIIERDLANPDISETEKQELFEQLKDLRALERDFFRRRIVIEPRKS